MVRSGKSTREVARHFGYSQSAVVKWCKKVPENFHQYKVIPTESSKPRHHPHELNEETVRRILSLRAETRRGAEFIHFLLTREGCAVSLSSVKRTLSRHGLTKYSKWKKWHQSAPRPLPEFPGVLVETDTIHDGRKDGSEGYRSSIGRITENSVEQAPDSAEPTLQTNYARSETMGKVARILSFTLAGVMLVGYLRRKSIHK